MQRQMTQPREIFLPFLYLGVTAYGGLAMVEPIRRRIVQEKGWLSQKEFLDGLALCQLLPGATERQANGQWEPPGIYARHQGEKKKTENMKLCQ